MTTMRIILGLRRSLVNRTFEIATALGNWRGSGYCLVMTELLEKAVAAVAALPDDQQDEAEIEASLAEEARGEFATEEEVRAVWAKHGL